MCCDLLGIFAHAQLRLAALSPNLQLIFNLSLISHLFFSLPPLSSCLPSQGQSESKKHSGHGKASRRHNGNPGQQQDSMLATQSGETGTLQTKGTAMSFGFRKKLNGTPKKLKKLLHEATKDDNGNATVGE